MNTTILIIEVAVVVVFAGAWAVGGYRLHQWYHSRNPKQ
jgi:hypothetical protein